MDGPWIVEEVTILGARFNNPATLGKPLPLSEAHCASPINLPAELESNE